MRLYSTPQSALAGEVTILAILETVAATAFSIWWVLHRGTITHIVIGAAVAPFLLLRTDESVNLAAKMRDTMELFSDEFPVSLSLIAYVFSFPFIRPLSIIRTAISSPLAALKMIPQNWNRSILATDSFHPPECLPEVETRQDLYKGLNLRFSSALNIFRGHHGGANTTGERLTLLLVVVVWFLPALLYRYSLKATAIVYIPLLWILHDSLVDAATLKDKLEDIAGSPLETIKRWYSWFVIVFLLLIPAAIYVLKNEWWKQLSSFLERSHPAAAALLSAFVPTSSTGLHIAAWHFARGVNALLTLALFHWAYVKLRRIERDTLAKLESSVTVLNLWLLTRGLLTLYIIGCTLYIIIAAVTWKDLWPIHIKWLPWQ